MKAEWRTLLSVNYLNSISCWATLEDLQKVIKEASTNLCQGEFEKLTNSDKVTIHEHCTCSRGSFERKWWRSRKILVVVYGNGKNSA